MQYEDVVKMIEDSEKRVDEVLKAARLDRHEKVPMSMVQIGGEKNEYRYYKQAITRLNSETAGQLIARKVSDFLSNEGNFYTSTSKI